MYNTSNCQTTNVKFDCDLFREEILFKLKLCKKKREQPKDLSFEILLKSRCGKCI